MNISPSQPPLTLSNPRHESFALALAQGLLPETAYRNAGFSDNNRKARAQHLAQDPAILARIAHLRSCIPAIDALRDRFAPSLLLMPETKDQLIAWLWQVMSGTRKVLPLQLRAATLFARLNGWHLHPKTLTTEVPAKPAKPIALLPEERQMLDHLARQTISADLNHRPLRPEETTIFYSYMADTALLTTLLAELSSVEPTTSLGERACSPRMDGLQARHPSSPPPPILSPDVSSVATSSLPSVASAKEAATVKKDGDPKSPSIPLEPQPLTSSQSPNGDEFAAAAERTADTLVGIIANPTGHTSPPERTADTPVGIIANPISHTSPLEGTASTPVSIIPRSHTSTLPMPQSGIRVLARPFKAGITSKHPISSTASQSDARTGA